MSWHLPRAWWSPKCGSRLSGTVWYHHGTRRVGVWCHLRVVSAAGGRLSVISVVSFSDGVGQYIRVCCWVVHFCVSRISHRLVMDATWRTKSLSTQPDCTECAQAPLVSVQSQCAVSSLGSTAHVHQLCNTSEHCFETMFCVIYCDSLELQRIDVS